MTQAVGAFFLVLCVSSSSLALALTALVVGLALLAKH